MAIRTRTHYSPLKQINRANVKQLELVWSYDTGEAGGLQTSPIEVGGVLYGISPSQKVFAVDAASGKVKWKFDSGILGTQPDRGLTYWVSSDNKDRRIIVGVMNFVYELDADTGQPVKTFGNQGRIDLREGLGRDVATGFIALTSPAVVYKDLFIVGGRLPETLPALPVTSAPTTFTPENSAGAFTPSHIRASSVTTLGRKTHGKKAGA